MLSNRTTLYILLAIVCLVPLPFASVTLWAWPTFAVATALLLAVWAGSLVWRNEDPPVPLRRIAVPALLFGLVVVWIIVQAAPFTPQSWHHPIWSEAARALGVKLSGAVSVDPGRTITGLARLLWYAAVFWLALQLCRERDHARRAVAAITIAGVVYATYGLIMEFSGGDLVLWLKKSAYVGDLTSTFINRNSYATYAGLGLICAVAILARRLIEIEVAAPTAFARLTMVLTEVLSRHWHVAVACLILTTALLMTNSRAGVVASFIGLVVFVVALVLSRSIPSRPAKWFGFSVIAIAVVFAIFSGRSFAERLATTGPDDYRFAIYGLTVEAIGDAPVLGMGFGTYDRVFQLYRRGSVEFQQPARRAHNTYLENALELGIPAATALVLAVGWLAGLSLLGVLRRHRDAFYPAIGAGGTALVGTHSALDFSLQIPAVAVTYLFLLGLACAQSWSTRDPRLGDYRG
jgi:O-antigen ligase